MISQPNPPIPLPCHATSPSCQGEDVLSDIYNHQFRSVYDSNFYSCLEVNGNCLGECQQALKNVDIVARFVQTNLSLEQLKEKLNYTSRINVNRGFKNELVVAFWIPSTECAFFGRTGGQNSNSYANSLTAVAHEFGHMLNKKTINLLYWGESGALDESYADVFAILVSNQDQNQTNDYNRQQDWNWNIGGPARTSIKIFRNLQNPLLYDQPEHWDNWVNTTDDNGGVHYNSGIHNRAVYELLISRDHNGNYLFDIGSAAELFYQALLRLNRFLEPNKDGSYEPTFLDSRKAMVLAAQTQFGSRPEQMRQVTDAIASAFDSVGVVQEPPSDRENTLSGL
jgi:Zn-dependent metalloprotease